MVAERVIRVEPGSELDRVLSEYGAHAVVLIWRGQRFRLVENPEPPSHPQAGTEMSSESAASIARVADEDS